MRRDFDLILCTLTQTDQLHIGCRFDFEAMRIMMIATLDHQRFVQIRGSLERLCNWDWGEQLRNFSESISVDIAHLNVSDVLPESFVLDGFVALSKLNVFGLSECGDAVVEFAIHDFESVMVFWIVVFVAVDDKYVVPLFPGTVTDGSWLWFDVVIWPSNGLGDESGDDVSDETYAIMKQIY